MLDGHLIKKIHSRNTQRKLLRNYDNNNAIGDTHIDGHERDDVKISTHCGAINVLSITFAKF